MLCTLFSDCAGQGHLSNARHGIWIGVFLQGTLLNKEVSTLALSSSACEN